MTLRPLYTLAFVLVLQSAYAEPDAAPAPAEAAASEAPVTPIRALSTSIEAVEWATKRTSDLLSTALASIGVKYRRGASDPLVGFDCSGFVRHVYKQALGLLLPHNAYSMSLQGRSVGVNELQLGDLVFFNTLKHSFSHVGIYLGDDRFIHAPRTGKSVQVDSLSDSYWVRHFSGARRIDAASADDAAPKE